MIELPTYIPQLTFGVEAEPDSEAASAQEKSVRICRVTLKSMYRICPLLGDTQQKMQI